VRLRALAVPLALAASLAHPGSAQTARVRDLIQTERVAPRRLVGYGLVVGLEGTGDRSLGTTTGSVQTVRSVVNLLRRFDVAVPPERLRLRNVAAVLVTAEVSAYVRPGGRFDVQVASLGDATSLHGGILWITPLVEDPTQPAVATAQGPLLLSADAVERAFNRGGTAGRVPGGGVIEAGVTLAAASPTDTVRLLLRVPDLATATRIAGAINAAVGPGTAVTEDPGAVRLTPPAQAADTLWGFLAALDTLPVDVEGPARLVVDARNGTVVTGGTLRVGAASVSHGGLTLTIGDPSVGTRAGTAAAAGTPDSSRALPPTGVVRASAGASVQEIAAALQVSGARPRDVAAFFEALSIVGALRATVVVR